MSSPSRYVTILIHSDGTLESRSIRLPVWALRLATGGAIALSAGLLLGAALYLPLVAAAARVPVLERELTRVKAENARIRELVAALDSAETHYDRIRSMLGADLVPDPVKLTSTLPVAPASRAAMPGGAPVFETGPSLPTHWPLEEPGYVTRGQVGRGSAEEEHPGLDIAVPIGTMVRASGGGTVNEAGEDGEYGRFILLDHPEGYQSMYGHLSRLTVAVGQSVSAGEVIGLSGNTGRSSAPHLHFETRFDGKAVDPATLVKEAP
jgi:murein DD-endopeptidase MepM/ murein hydrolase activator NlpD